MKKRIVKRVADLEISQGVALFKFKHPVTIQADENIKLIVKARRT
jgi:hypothetical protein